MNGMFPEKGECMLLNLTLFRFGGQKDPLPVFPLQLLQT